MPVSRVFAAAQVHSRARRVIDEAVWLVGAERIVQGARRIRTR